MFYWKNINKRKPCLRTIKVWAKNDHKFIIYKTYDHFRYYRSAYSGSFYWPCGLRSTFLISVISPWDRDQTENKTCQQTLFRKRIFMFNRIESVIFSTEMCIFRPELTGKWGPHGIKILSLWNTKMKYING